MSGYEFALADTGLKRAVFYTPSGGLFSEISLNLMKPIL
jgi:hypothetical protein